MKYLLLWLGLSLPALAQEPYRAPALSDPKSWTMVVLPDPQNYVKFAENQPLFDLMTVWVRQNAAKLNIGLVLCTGDLVDQNLNPHPDGTHGNQTGTQQWEAVSKSFAHLDGQVPYILCTGNHDYGIKNAENRYSQFQRWFPPERNPLTNSLLKAMTANAQGIPTLENACYSFTDPHGQKRLIFSLEFLPRKEVVDWAGKLAADPGYADHTGIVLTHSYLRSSLKNNEPIDAESYPLGTQTVGRELWKTLLAPSRNLQLLICGHVADSEGHEGHVGYREDRNAAGKTVAQMLFNAQREGGGWHGNGGDGWLRLLEFLPDGHTIVVRTFSPLFAASPATQHLAWRMAPIDSFRIDLSK